MQCQTPYQTLPPRPTHDGNSGSRQFLRALADGHEVIMILGTPRLASNIEIADRYLVAEMANDWILIHIRFLQEVLRCSALSAQREHHSRREPTLRSDQNRRVMDPGLHQKLAYIS